MGKLKYIKRVRELFKKSPVVSFKSIARICGSSYAKQLIRILMKKNEIKRICKGYYSYFDDPSLLVFCFKPAYLGLQDALSIHNLWEQETIPIVITSKKVRQGIRNVLGINVLVKRINKNFIFGIKYIKHGSFYLPYSDLEKTLIDFIYFKEKLNKKILKKIIKKIDKEKLKSYAKRYPEKIRKVILRLIS